METRRGSSDAPFVGCFSTHDGKYVYDVNMNEVIRVTPDAYFQILDTVRSGKNLDNCHDKTIHSLVAEGYLSGHRAKTVRLSLSRDSYKRKLTSNLSYAVLEPTRCCNFNCTYCLYSEELDGRRDHSAEYMSWETAKASIDLLLKSSENETVLNLGFYGGEPLIAWPLIKRCIVYCNDQTSKELHFSLTTNGSLITDDIANECSQLGISVTVSLDGPQATHDANRVFRTNDEGTFSFAMRGLRLLRRAYGRQVISLLRLNAVIGPWTNLAKLAKFFEFPPEEIVALDYRLSYVAYPYGVFGAGDDSHWFHETVDAARIDWAEFLAENSHAPSVESRHAKFMSKLFEADLLKFYKRCRLPLGESLPPMGHCAPGLRKFYVDVDGNIHMCEKVSEQLSIGNVHGGGIDVDECLNVTDEIAEFFGERCPECVMCRLCNGCSATYTDHTGEFSREAMEMHCERMFLHWKKTLMSWAMALESNPACFDYMEEITLS